MRHRLDAVVVFGLMVAVFLALSVRSAPSFAAESPAPTGTALAALAVGVISQPPEPSDIYDADPLPDDYGIAGGRLAVKDSNTTGRLIGQTFSQVEKIIASDDDPLPALQELIDAKIHFIVVNLPTDKLLKVSDAVKGKDIFIFNAGNMDESLRAENCRDNIMHVAPSRSMLTDALAEFLIFKRWRNWFMILGPNPGDQAYADALRHSAKKFAAKIVVEKTWEFGPDGRRTAQQEVPLFTQGYSYDVVVIADERGDFGQYVEFHTWDPRPTAGTAGLTPESWNPQAEQNGAVQLNNRFKKLANRKMTSLDFNVWLAVRAVTESASRIKSVDTKALSDFIRGPDFDLAGFKGVALTFRTWDWQLRQPILLSNPAALVSMSPQPGFLHQNTPLDTLGVDKPETKCKLK